MLATSAVLHNYRALDDSWKKDNVLGSDSIARKELDDRNSISVMG